MKKANNYKELQVIKNELEVEKNNIELNIKVSNEECVQIYESFYSNSSNRLGIFILNN